MILELHCFNFKNIKYRSHIDKANAIRMIALLKCTLRTAVVTETRQRKMSSISSRQTLNRIFITFDTLMSQDTEKNKRIITRFEE